MLSLDLLGSTRRLYSRSHSTGLRLLQLLKATLVLLQPRCTATSKASWVVSPLPDFEEGTIASAGADAYCESRARGGTHRQASNAAVGVAVRLGFRSENFSDAWYEQARSTSQILCPELQPVGLYN